MKDVSIIFVIDPPKLVTDGVLLLASIRRHMPDIEVIGYCPQEKAETMPAQVSEYFAANNAEIRFIDAQDKFSPPYPHGNKLLACAAPRDTKFTLFLDTDIVLWQPFDPAEIFAENTVSAAPEGVMTWGKPKENWPLVYGMFDLPVPEETVQLARSNAKSLPYFNAGVVGFPNVPVAGFPSFGALWLDTAQQIDANEEVPTRRPWVDQIAMPVAIARAGWAYKPLEKRWNLSLSRNIGDALVTEKDHEKAAKTIDKMNAVDAVILHYHASKFIYGTRYEGYFEDLAQEFTCFSKLEDLTQRKPLKKTGALKEIKQKIKEIKSVPRKERTDEQRSEFAAIRAKRKKIRNRVTPPSFEAWPDSILPAEK
ncbi:hypothetical protein [Paracoccus ravus]|uniref:hypothetical protein n=1 Tax=Paracoccus ravus TaxID=2447760 RepID=UPI00106E1C03|nr:hypothetical protein [Paracoccus ravus]